MSQMPEGRVPELTAELRLLVALRHAGVTIEEMADELGVTRQTVGRWVNGRGRPRTGYLRLWAMRCGVPFRWLADGGGAQSHNLTFRGLPRRAA